MYKAKHAATESFARSIELSSVLKDIVSRPSFGSRGALVLDAEDAA